jgi:putative addiction module killer protein
MSIIKVLTYSIKTNGEEPFSDWLDDQDLKTQSIVFSRLDRVSLGNFGDCKQIKDGEGVWELRIDHGPGYRIYFGKKGMTLIILLVGGEKKSQSRDIAKAKRYWLDCKGVLHG